MRLQITKSANSENFYVIRSVRRDGKNTSEVVEKLGNVEEVRKKAGEQDPYEWAKEYTEKLTMLEKENTTPVLISLLPSKRIEKDNVQKFNGGYLFLQKIYSELKIKDICKAIGRRRNYEYNLNNILSRLVYCRIINPLSKIATFEYSQKLLEPPKFELHQVYRALDVIAEESEYIQEKLYLNSKKIIERNTDVLYYDCTNYFFEIEQEKGIRKYGACKENRPLPIVEMGLMMDGNGIPIAFCIHDGNTNEQTTLKPLEERILKDFDLSKFIVCTDAGLSFGNNKFFNSRKERNFITTTSVKKIPIEQRKHLLNSFGWKLVGQKNEVKYDLDEIEANEKTRLDFYDKTFYKEEWFIDRVDVYDHVLKKTVKRDLSQRLIITFSFKYRDYLRTIRDKRIDRAKKLIDQGDIAIKRKSKNDVRQFIQELSYTDSGEIADRRAYSLNEDFISNLSQYDGFYAVYTSLDSKKYPVSKINQINHGRWEIEECFRIMNSEFQSRPVYLQKDIRIKAHFMICFISLLILRILENKLDHKFTYTQIIDCLSDMDFTKLKNSGYIPSYTRTDLTDSIHSTFGFRTDFEFISDSLMKNIFSLSKKS